MRRPFARVSQTRPRRFGAALALLALLVQMLLPSASALAMADPLREAPICTTGAGHPDGPHKALHAVCPLCQGQAVAWGFVPPTGTFVIGPQRLVRVTWHRETRAAAPVATVGFSARGPPVAA